MTEPTSEKPPEHDDGPAKTPFDNPWFLPVMFWLFTAWFGWDAWIVPMEEHLAFNRYGFFIVLVLALWFTRKGLHEHREDKEREAAENGAPPLS
jgi:hypothetical protein